MNPRAPPEKSFIQKLQRDRSYNDLLVRLSIDTGFNEQFFQKALEPLSVCCWRHAREMVEAQVPKLQQQVIDLQDQLRSCNLTAMKEISNMRAQQKEHSIHIVDIEDMKADISFHEPLAYLDDTTRELVMTIVLDKLNQFSQQQEAERRQKERIKGRHTNEDDIEELRDKLKRQEEMALQNKIAMDQMSKTLKERRDAEVQALVALAAHQQDVERLVQERLQMELARLQTSNGSNMQVQTELTSQSLQEMFEAAAKMRVTCAQLRKRLAGVGNDDECANALRNSLDEFANAQTVFLRLWEDALLRYQGSHRRDRAPAGQIPPKTFLPAKAISKPSVITDAHTGRASEDTILVQEEGESSHHVVFASDDNVAASRLEGQPPAPPIASDELPVLQGPKFSRQKKTVSLALLAPRARNKVESHVGLPLDLLHRHSLGNQKQEALNSPKQRNEGLLETVSGFLKQRRRMQGEDPPRLFTMPESKVGGDTHSAPRARILAYNVSRLGASSTPALVRLRPEDLQRRK